MADGTTNLGDRLRHLLDETSLVPFNPMPYYCVHDDSFICYWKDSLAYASEVNQHITLYLGCGSGEPVGVKIKGVKGLTA